MYLAVLCLLGMSAIALLGKYTTKPLDRSAIRGVRINDVSYATPRSRTSLFTIFFLLYIGGIYMAYWKVRHRFLFRGLMSRVAPESNVKLRGAALLARPSRTPG